MGIRSNSGGYRNGDLLFDGESDETKHERV
jgi:hypothetical protein